MYLDEDGALPVASPGGGRWEPLSNSDHSLRPPGRGRETRYRDNKNNNNKGAELG